MNTGIVMTALAASFIAPASASLFAAFALENNSYILFLASTLNPTPKEAKSFRVGLLKMLSVNVLKSGPSNCPKSSARSMMKSPIRVQQ